MIPTTNTLVERIRAALERLKPNEGIVHVSVANHLTWERSPGQGDEVLVRWLCWSIDDGDREIAPPEFEVAGKEVTRQRLASELPRFLPGVTVTVDDDIDA